MRDSDMSGEDEDASGAATVGRKKRRSATAAREALR